MTVFSDGFESGDFTAWTNTTGSPTVQGAVKKSGSYAMQVSMPSTNTRNTADYTITGSPSVIYARCYFRCERLPDASKGATLLYLQLSGGGIGDSVQVVYAYESGVYKWVFYDSSGFTSYEETINTGQWYCLEIGYNANTDTQVFYRDGEALITRNIATSQTVTGYTIGFRHNYIGTGWSATASNAQWDDIVIDNSYIGSIYNNDIINEIFSDGFENNDFSQWTTTSENGASISVSNNTAHSGSYAAKISSLTNNGYYAYASKSIEDATQLNGRVYVKFTSNISNGTQISSLIRFQVSTVTSYYIDLERQNDGTYRWHVIYQSTPLDYASPSFTLNLDTWYCIELGVVVNAVSGQLNLWVNDAHVINQTGLSLYSGGVDSVRIQAWNSNGATNSGDIYFDCFKVAESYIGPDLTVNDIIESREYWQHKNQQEFMDAIYYHEFIVNGYPNTSGHIRFYDLNPYNGGHNYVCLYGEMMGDDPSLVCSQHLTVEKDFLAKGMLNSLEGEISLNGGDYAPGWSWWNNVNQQYRTTGGVESTKNPFIWLSQGGIYGNYGTLEIRVSASDGNWNWGDLACGQLTLASTNLFLDSGAVRLIGTTPSGISLLSVQDGNGMLATLAASTLCVDHLKTNTETNIGGTNYEVIYPLTTNTVIGGSSVFGGNSLYLLNTQYLYANTINALTGNTLTIAANTTFNGTINLASSSPTSGYVLTAQGAGNPPVWAPVSGGGSIPWTAVPSSINPSADNTYSLGSGSYAWQGIVAYTIYANNYYSKTGGNATFHGDLTGTANYANTAGYANPYSHNHSASETTSGTFDLARIPSGLNSKISWGSISDNLTPSTNDTYSLGNGSYYWHGLVANYVYYKNLSSFDALDDLDLLKKYTTQKVTLKQGTEEVEVDVITYDSFDFLKRVKESNEDEDFWDGGKVMGYLIGCLKSEVIAREKLEQSIKELKAKIEENS